jgi:hypothetical protein
MDSSNSIRGEKFWGLMFATGIINEVTLAEPLTQHTVTQVQESSEY